MSRAIADTSAFIALESGRRIGELPDELAVSVVTAAELELGVLRARDPETRATRLATLSRVRGDYPLLAIDEATASCFARIADEELRAGRKLAPTRHVDRSDRAAPPCSRRDPGQGLQRVQLGARHPGLTNPTTEPEGSSAPYSGLGKQMPPVAVPIA